MFMVTNTRMARRSTVILAVALALQACGGGDDGGGPTTQPPPAPPGPTNPNAVQVADNVFDPAGTSIASASTITWTWVGSAPHNVTFEDGNGSSSTQTSGTHSRAFSAAGTFRYRCTIHSSNFTSGMVGSVTVR